MATLGNLIVNVGTKLTDLKAGLGKARGMVKGFGSVLSGIATGVVTGGLALVAGGIIGIGTAAVVTGSQVLSFSSELRQAQNDIVSSLGASQEEAERLGDVAVDVFRNNFYGSVTEATAAVVEARKQLGDLADNELQDAAENAARLSDTFGVDYAESLNAARVLHKEFGLSQQEAFDFIAAGFQKGLNSSGDFLDTIGEYSNLFAQGGASAGEFFSTLETGLAGGVLGTDKAADAFKEFTLRIGDGSKTTRDALSSLGEDWDIWEQEMAKGNLSASQAFKWIIEDLNDIQDPLEQNRIGVALFGTQWEDMGARAMLSLDTQKTALEDMSGAIDALDAKYKNWGALWEGAKRQAIVALSPIGERLLNLANEKMPLVQAGIDKFVGALSSGVDTVMPYVDRVTDAFSEGGLSGAVGELGTIFEEVWPTVQAKLGEWGQNFWDWITGSGGAIENAEEPMGNLIDSTNSLLEEKWPLIREKLQGWADNFWNWVLGKDGQPGALQKSTEALNSLVEKAQAWVESDEGQGALTELGRNLGTAGVEGMKLVFENQDEINALMETLGVALVRGAFSMDAILREVGDNIALGIIDSITDALLGEGAARGNIGTGFLGTGLTFQGGGIVPGAEGSPRLAMVHGGEVILNREQQMALAGEPGNVQINIYDARDPDKVGDEVEKRLRKLFKKAR